MIRILDQNNQVLLEVEETGKARVDTVFNSGKKFTIYENTTVPNEIPSTSFASGEIIQDENGNKVIQGILITMEEVI